MLNKGFMQDQAFSFLKKVEKKLWGSKYITLKKWNFKNILIKKNIFLI